MYLIFESPGIHLHEIVDTGMQFEGLIELSTREFRTLESVEPFDQQLPMPIFGAIVTIAEDRQLTEQNWPVDRTDTQSALQFG